MNDFNTTDARAAGWAAARPAALETLHALYVTASERGEWLRPEYDAWAATCESTSNTLRFPKIGELPLDRPAFEQIVGMWLRPVVTHRPNVELDALVEAHPEEVHALAEVTSALAALEELPCAFERDLSGGEWETIHSWKVELQQRYFALAAIFMPDPVLLHGVADPEYGVQHAAETARDVAPAIASLRGLVTKWAGRAGDHPDFHSDEFQDDATSARLIGMALLEAHGVLATSDMDIQHLRYCSADDCSDWLRDTALYGPYFQLQH